MDMKERMLSIARCFAALAVARAIWRAAYIQKRFSSLYTFGIGVAFSELPFHALILQCVLLWKRVYGDFPALPAAENNEPRSVTHVLRSATNILSLAATVSTLYPLVKMIGQQLQSRQAYAHALSASGFAHHSIITEKADIATRAKQFAACILPAPHLLQFGLERRVGVTYAKVMRSKRGLYDLKLDLYWHPTRVLPSAPILCYIHGGAWITGNRNHHSLALIYEMAKQGWVVASISYRLAPKEPYPGMLYDCKRAIIWLRRNAKRFGANPNFVCVAGESAGGHLALMVALTGDVEAFQPVVDTVTGVGVDPKPGRPLSPTHERLSDSTAVQGVVDLYGVTDWTDSGHQYLSRDPNGGIREFVGKLVLRKKYAAHFEEFIAGSPMWWLFGSRLPAMLEKLGVTLTSEPPTAEVVTFPEGDAEAAASTPAQVHLATASTSSEAVEVEGLPYRKFSGACSLPAIRYMCKDRPVPPTLIIHGDSDTLVPLQDSTRFFKALQQRRMVDRAVLRADGHARAAELYPLIPDSLVILPGAHHAFNFVMSPRTFGMSDAVATWLQKLHSAWQMQHGDQMPATAKL